MSQEERSPATQAGSWLPPVGAQLRLSRDLSGTGPKEADGRRRWARWQVIDVDTGKVVGVVVEDREWLGWTYGPSTYGVSHNLGGCPFGSLWASRGHPTPAAALGTLVDHLARPGGRRQ